MTNEWSTLFLIYSGKLPNRRFGYMDCAGNTVIEPQYHGAGIFSEGLGAVAISGKMGFINGANEVVVEPRFDLVSPFKCGYAHCWLSHTHVYVDRTGNAVAEHSFKDSFDVTEDYIPVAFSPFNNALMSFDGELSCVGSFLPLQVAEGKVAFGDGQGAQRSYGYRKPTGEWLLTPLYRMAWPFSEALAAVHVRIEGAAERVQFINASGAIVIPPSNYTVSDCRFTEGHVCVWKRFGRSEKAGFLNKQGEEVIPCAFDNAKPFSGGIAAVQRDQKWGYADHHGNMVTGFLFDFAGSFRDGLAQVIHEGHPAYIDKIGNIIWRGTEVVFTLGRPIKLSWA